MYKKLYFVKSLRELIIIYLFQLSSWIRLEKPAWTGRGIHTDRKLTPQG